MDFHKIAVEFSDSNVLQLQQFISILGEIRSSVSVKKTDSLKEESISYYTFIVEDEVIKQFLIKLKNQNLKVVSYDEINNKMRSYRAKKVNESTKIGIEGLKHSIKKKSVKNLIDSGEYKGLLAIIKDIRTDQSKRRQAEAGLPEALKIAVDLNYDKAIVNKNRAFNALEELISIASNPQLKDPKLNQLIIRAGNKAIQICTNYKDYTSDLIKISSNNNIPYIINVKAVVKFAEITLNGSRDHNTEFDEDVKYAINRTNLRWLRIVLDTIGNVLSAEEMKYYNDFMSFIEFKKFNK